MEENIESEIKYLYEIEGLSRRQIAQKLKVCRNRVARIIKGTKMVRLSKPTMFSEYERIIQEWYKEYPFLQAKQVYEKLKEYGFKGSYTSVCLYTLKYRQKKCKAYHELDFLPGEEAQIDWVEVRLAFGIVYGFVYIHSYSRYVYVKFYPAHSFEFFLEGHISAFKAIGGLPQRCRYDNLKSVVISRKPVLKYNSQFLDFARHYGFSIYVCNPYRPNEKGRVERIIRDIRNFIRVNNFENINDLNNKISVWQNERNNKIHSITEKAPTEMLKEEKLKSLPAIHYSAYKVSSGSINTTGFIEFETNKYSVPSEYCGIHCEIFAYTDYLEVVVKGKKIAHHKRLFAKKQKIENPKHREKLFCITPDFKYQRIYQVMKKLDTDICKFVNNAEIEGEDGISVAYELFKILRAASKEMFLSAVREANNHGIIKISYLKTILHITDQQEGTPIYPCNTKLLEINYERRNLDEYDKLI